MIIGNSTLLFIGCNQMQLPFILNFLHSEPRLFELTRNICAGQSETKRVGYL